MQQDQQKRLFKLINGCLHSTIVAHGPITKDNLSSATKRIINQLFARKIVINDSELQLAVLTFITNWVTKRYKGFKRRLRAQDKSERNNIRARNKAIKEMLVELKDGTGLTNQDNELELQNHKGYGLEDYEKG